MNGTGELLPGVNRTIPQTKYFHLVAWSVIDTCLALAIILGNTLTICAIKLSRRLSALVSNQFIFSLALSDLLVGLTLPYHLAFYVSQSLGNNEYTCILRFVLIILAWTLSIYNLIAIAVDRFIAIVYPLHYNKYVTKRVAYTIILSGWMLACLLSTAPIYWNTFSSATQCEFDHVLPESYVTFIMTPMFVLIWIAMLVLYWRIWREAAGQARRLRNATNYHNAGSSSDWKSVQVVLIILGCFSACWLPYIVLVLCIIAFGFNPSTSIVYECAFTLAMANSGMNPVIYAWKNASFRKAFSRLMHCSSPNQNDFTTNHDRMESNRKKTQPIKTVYGLCDLSEKYMLREMEMSTNGQLDQTERGTPKITPKSYRSQHTSITAFGQDEEAIRREVYSTN